MIRPTDLVVSLVDVEESDAHHLGGASFEKDGFVVTTQAYYKFLFENSLETKIKHLIGSINFNHPDSLPQVSRHIKKLISTSRIPNSVQYKVLGHYEDLGTPQVTMRLSVISGDPEQKKWANEKSDTISGDAVLFDTLRSFWAHLFEPGFILYRNSKNIDHLRTGAAVIVQTN